MEQFRGSVRIRVTENVTLENLQGIIAHIAGMAGCTHCGIMGVDLQLSGDPVEFQQIAKLPGVKSASLGP
ncbi:MAG: hypothetical protein ACXVAS_06150, partial [Vulcanimicrobiaceae bacterium]